MNSASEWTSEWPSTTVCIIGSYRPTTIVSHRFPERRRFVFGEWLCSALRRRLECGSKRARKSLYTETSRNRCRDATAPAVAAPWGRGKSVRCFYRLLITGSRCCSICMRQYASLRSRPTHRSSFCFLSSQIYKFALLAFRFPLKPIH